MSFKVITDFFELPLKNEKNSTINITMHSRRKWEYLKLYPSHRMQKATSQKNTFKNLEPKLSWICGTGLEPRRMNWPPNSNVRYIAFLIRWTPFWGTNLVMQATCTSKHKWSANNLIQPIHKQVVIKFSTILTNGCLALAEDNPRCLLKASLFSALPSISLEWYWTFRKGSVAGFHASVSIPFKIPANFFIFALIVWCRPCPP